MPSYRICYRVLLPLVALFVLSACDSNDATFDIGTYEGTQTITEEGEAPEVEEITIVLSANESAGTVTLTVTPESGLAEVSEGTYNEEGMVFTQESGFGSDFVLTVAPDGDVGGGGMFNILSLSIDIDVDGTFTAQQINIVATSVTTDSNSGTTTTTVSQTRATRS